MGEEQKKHQLGLLGRNIDYSFSQGYFKRKFEQEGLTNFNYQNFDLVQIEDVQGMFLMEDLLGFNITIPYKEAIIPYLDQLHPDAKNIGAVNTVILKDGNRIGYNTDAYGFEHSITPHLKSHHHRALVLGTGGASKAIAFVLEKIGIDYKYVSRNNSKGRYIYDELNAEIIKNHSLIINCTPLGTFPDIEKKPNIPYESLTENHLLYDLIYNPPKTQFLRLGEEKGAVIINGKNMLELQAEKAWEIWTEHLS